MSHLTLEEEENQHSDEVAIRAVPATAFSQSLLRLRVMSTEQPAGKQQNVHH